MWYLFLAIGIYAVVYTASYGVWELKNGNKPAFFVVCFLCVVASLIPAVKIFLQ